MAFQRFDKDPDATLDYVIDWSDWLTGGDTITDATATAATATGQPADIIDSFEFNTTTTTVWLSGGTPGHNYLLTVHATTDEGREDDRSFLVVIEQR